MGFTNNLKKKIINIQLIGLLSLFVVRDRVRLVERRIERLVSETKIVITSITKLINETKIMIQILIIHSRKKLLKSTILHYLMTLNVVLKVNKIT